MEERNIGTLETAMEYRGEIEWLVDQVSTRLDRVTKLRGFSSLEAEL